MYDREGEGIITACACTRILHHGDGVVVRKLQAALARLCVQYALRRGGMDHERFLDRMNDAIAAREAEILKEVAG